MSRSSTPMVTRTGSVDVVGSFWLLTHTLSIGDAQDDDSDFFNDEDALYCSVVAELPSECQSNPPALKLNTFQRSFWRTRH
jgi:hypothetical protein